MGTLAVAGLLPYALLHGQMVLLKPLEHWQSFDIEGELICVRELHLLVQCPPEQMPQVGPVLGGLTPAAFTPVPIGVVSLLLLCLLPC